MRAEIPLDVKRSHFDSIYICELIKLDVNYKRPVLKLTDLLRPRIENNSGSEGYRVEN